jgi:glycosyltransferase involved in cell wall biosynthesis
MRILLGSNMYPSAERPEYGIFVKGLAEALRERGHELDEAVIEAGGGGLGRYVVLGERALRGTRPRPDVVYAHYLVPTGLAAWAAARTARVPYVITAHGQDVENARTNPNLRRLTQFVVRGSAGVIAVSRYLAERLPPGARSIDVIDCGVDTVAFTPEGWRPGPGPRYLAVGSLIERKNIARLLRAFAEVGRGTLTIVGDGPGRAQLEAIAPLGVTFAGRLDQAGVREALRRADALVIPSLVEPQGQVVLEALACGVPVVATDVGGPREVLTPASGVLVDPHSVSAIAAGMVAVLDLPAPNASAVEVARAHDRRRQAERIEAVLARAVGARRGR